VVTRLLQVERRIAKARWLKTDVLPLDHATKVPFQLEFFCIAYFLVFLGTEYRGYKFLKIIKIVTIIIVLFSDLILFCCSKDFFEGRPAGMCHLFLTQTKGHKTIVVVVIFFDFLTVCSILLMRFKNSNKCALLSRNVVTLKVVPVITIAATVRGQSHHAYSCGYAHVHYIIELINDDDSHAARNTPQAQSNSLKSVTTFTLHECQHMSAPLCFALTGVTSYGALGAHAPPRLPKICFSSSLWTGATQNLTATLCGFLCKHIC